jgi:WD40 repeat protein
VSASADGHIAVWDLESWQCEFKWKAHKSWVTKVAIVSKPRWIISSSLDGLIAVWKIQSQPPTQPEFHLQDQGGAVWSFDLDW